MSGHSHWKSIKHKKGIADKAKSKVFSKLSQAISIAVQEKGPDPETNSKLRLAIETARSFSLPRDTIERAIKKGSGELEGKKLEPITFEAYGPGGIAIIVESITDNKNRTVNEIKQILNQNNGKLADAGAVKWLFERRGIITLRITNQYEYTNKEDLELKVIEAGAEDITWNNNALNIYTKIEDFDKVKKNLESQEIKIESASLDWVAKENVQTAQKYKEATEKLFAALDESDSVQEIYSNLKV
ncbi:MAG TPA: YebC/PmpR family DNA-binding transcriptional regulator [Candidatus Nealsonbacteria bacterium]|uniref:Transcriptional regulatory protein n=1 Tax=marine sediment metagenome TaxID=412755 RepID=A0A0F9UVN2_9ZZZZ|nr:YebC/PmpR family DNA-binding transcriptional regulator [Candidatus Nealsonbacteria bacterium]HEB46256.1 YebC/PmpR family DNA-binding transcriptional regulator [Candidatus Nealsonbacteria bacterium]